MSSTIPENSTKVAELKEFLKQFNWDPETTHFSEGNDLKDVTQRVRAACSGGLEKTKSGETVKRSWLQRLFWKKS